MATTKEARRKKVIETLNKARAMELYAIHQYMNHHYTLDDEDYGTLATKMRDIAIDEMRHAEWFAERIKDIDGEPTTDIDGKVMRGQNVDELYGFDAKAEDDTIEKYNEFMLICRENHDSVSATLFEKIINEEQEHFNYFDDTAKHVKELRTSFLAKAAGTEGDEG